MIIDQLQLRAIANELNSILSGSRINKIFQPEPNLLLLDIYPTQEKLRLALCADRQFGFTGLIDCKKGNPPIIPPFCKLLRNRLKGGIITSVSSYFSDRVVNFCISVKKDDSFVTKILQLRLTGNKPNIILLDTDDKNESTTGKLYDYPSETKLNREKLLTVPDEDTVASIILNSGSSNSLSEQLPGLPPALAEIVLHSCTSGPERIEVSKWLHLLLSNQLPLNPHTMTNNLSGRKLLLPYGPPPVTPANTSLTCHTSLLQAIEEFYFSNLKRHRFMTMQRALLKQLSGSKKKLTRKKCKLEDGLKKANTAHHYIYQGDLLKTVLHKVQPRSDSVTAMDWMKNSEVSIKLDSRLSPQQNLEKYFAKARKIKRSLPVLKQQIEETTFVLQNIELLIKKVETAGGQAALEEVVEKLNNSDLFSTVIKQKRKIRQNNKFRRHSSNHQKTAKGPGPAKLKKKNRKLQAGLRTFQSSDGLKIYVGRNGKENAFLSGKFLGKKDLWFHIRDEAGPHVVLKLGNRDQCPSLSKKEAAQLAVYFSNKRYEKRIQVNYCKGSEVRNVPGGKPGQVSLRNYNCITVTPDQNILKNVLAITVE